MYSGGNWRVRLVVVFVVCSAAVVWTWVSRVGGLWMREKFVSFSGEGGMRSRVVVVARTHSENTSWISTELVGWRGMVYEVDDPVAENVVPMNKGREVMVYLTYIVEEYDNLPEVVVFIHSHRFGWHNEEEFGFDMVGMLRRLDVEHVLRSGYFNLRCSWIPGCPDWIRPGVLEEDGNKPEQAVFAGAWREILPDVLVPEVVGQPCCGQFAVSRDRILAVPRASFAAWREWLIGTGHSDAISGRIWEYLWQVVFLGASVVCVPEDQCLCDGYGVCGSDSGVSSLAGDI